MGKGFRFKHFTVEDQDCGMPVSTDGVLLGAWAEAKDGHTILDIGTGTGLLALMMAQRFPTARITALDIDAHAAETARFNAEQSAWHDRIDVHHQDICTWESSAQFDTIVCNPPYFTTGEQANDARRAKARHTNTLSHDTLLNVIKARLSLHGEAHLILPSVEGENLITKAQTHQLFCCRKVRVKPTERKPVSRLLITLSKNRPADVEEKTLVIQGMARYTDEFIALTKDFYLKM
ncbi:SAM-dependent methyltransferase [Grimontia hollisae]|uniref:tRNA1(Val) (adenine(37)-N6)-methyltransferase n=1 Tax=Grimontia hollisae TaxID=673 RepID=UPI00058D9EBC|nr:methyltransferase [Grimontia hollisae]AMG31071.1 SAM-dependent methyltransferase [Grimontia hollisae]STO46768.1 tRNA1(Val) (adenine(37)-N6)-methyltransferase [Grimontia hollisae]